MKKFFTTAVLITCLIFSGMAIAGPPQHNNDSADISFGGYAINAKAAGGALDYDMKMIPNGFAGGISGSGGAADSASSGFVFNGSVKAEVGAVGGGLTMTDAYRWNPGMGDKSIGVGSYSENYAIAGANASLKVDPDGRLKYGFIPTAGGEADAHMMGAAGQATLNVSGLTGSPRYEWNTDGFTGGIAGQGSIGAFAGGAYAISGPDYEKWVRTGRCGWRKIDVDSKAGADMGAEITMTGYSYSDSYRFIDRDGGTKVEGMGTSVAAGTNVETYGYNHDWDRGLSSSGSCLKGGYVVSGGAAAKTVQYNDNGVAKATAVGFYAGAGSLNSNFTGSAVGGTHTTITTVGGMKGSIVNSNASMSITASNAMNNMP